MPLEMFVNEAEASYFYYEGDNIGPLANKRVRMREVKADMIGYTCELMAKCVNQDKLDMPLTRRRQGALRRLPRERGLSRLRPITPTRKNRDAVRATRTISRRCSSQDSALRIRSVMGGTGQAPMFQPIGGIDNFPKGFQRALGDKIALGCRSAVDQAERARREGGREEPEDRPGRRSSTADYCVSCLPLTVLSNARRQPVARDDGGGEGDAVQPEREDGAADEAALLGRGRPDLRRASLLEPAVRRVLLSVERLLRQEGRAARVLWQRPAWQTSSTCRSRNASSTC